jgi:hypothetical protein
MMSLLLFVSQQGYSQTWNEWFRQKKTQKKYLIQQIAALKIYLKYLKQGYGVVKKGMQIVGDIKEGNFNSHNQYFLSLEEVNEFVSGSGKVSTIIMYENATVQLIAKIRKDGDENSELTNEEKTYINKVCNNLLEMSEENVSNLHSLVNDHDLKMKDDERFNRLASLHTEAKEKYSFARSFYNDNRLLMLQRSKERSEIAADEKLLIFDAL